MTKEQIEDYKKIMEKRKNQVFLFIDEKMAKNQGAPIDYANHNHPFFS